MEFRNIYGVTILTLDEFKKGVRHISKPEIYFQATGSLDGATFTLELSYDGSVVTLHDWDCKLSKADDDTAEDVRQTVENDLNVVFSDWSLVLNDRHTPPDNPKFRLWLLQLQQHARNGRFTHLSLDIDSMLKEV